MLIRNNYLYDYIHIFKYVLAYILLQWEIRI